MPSPSTQSWASPECGPRSGLTPQCDVVGLRRIAIEVSPNDASHGVLSESDDDHTIAAIVTDLADLITKGDKRDLLSLCSYQGISIVTAREVVERLNMSAG